jgi:hypothetical protein
MRVILPTLVGMVALASVSAHAAPSRNKENWLPLGAPLSFGLGEQGCGEGRHQALWRDWCGDWWWGPCVPNWH